MASGAIWAWPDELIGRFGEVRFGCAAGERGRRGSRQRHAQAGGLPYGVPALVFPGLLAVILAC
jgi:hypothetical protein